MERMINDRLVWILESNNLISGNQAGFRKNYSTNDHLVRLENLLFVMHLLKMSIVSLKINNIVKCVNDTDSSL